MRTIAICNQKGGVGKTTTAVNLGIGLAKQGKKVLLIDLDPQGSLTLSLGNTQPDHIETTIATLLGKIIADTHFENNEGILKHKEGVDLIPSNIELSGLEVTLVNTMSRETILREYLKTMQNKYDYCIIDCTPSLGMLTINALACADEVMIPVLAHYLSIKGLEQLLKTVSKIRKQMNPKLKIAGILLTMVDRRTTYSKDIISLLHKTYGTSLNIYKNNIPLSVKASETSAVGSSIFKHAPNSEVASCYQLLVSEVMGNVA